MCKVFLILFLSHTILTLLVAHILSSAYAFKLDQSKKFSFGKELTLVDCRLYELLCKL